MKYPVIITIARQFGSGGHEIGRRLAERLGIPCYDKELLTHAAKESGLSEEVIAYFDEKPTSSLLYTLSTGAYALNETGMMNYSMPVNQQVFQAQFDAIRSLSEKGACVIVGRCADYILQNYPHLVTVFVHSDLEKRVARVAEFDKISLQEAKTRVTRSDKKRANYYNFYTGKKWGVASHYDIAINTGSVSYDNAIELIAQLAAMKYADEEE